MESLGSILKAPLGIFFWQTLCRIIGQTQGLQSKNLPRGSIHHDTPSAFPQIVPDCLAQAQVVREVREVCERHT